VNNVRVQVYVVYKMAKLDRTRIFEAALRIIERDGAHALTMRAVADELDVTPMALYRHVADKQALVALVVDSVIAEQVLPDPTGDWREDLLRMTSAMREVSLRHPAVSQLRRGHEIWTSPVLLPLTERWMSLWVQSGLPLEEALRAGVMTSMAVTGFIEQELHIGRMERPDEPSLAGSPNARAAFASKRDGAADFEVVIRSLIDGVHDRLAAGTPPDDG